MKALQNLRLVTLVSGAVLATNNTAVVAFVDTRDATEVSFLISGVAFDGTNANKLATLFLVESDDTNATNFTTITGSVGTTATTLGTNAFLIQGTSVTGTIPQNVLTIANLEGRKRYIGFVASSPNATANRVTAVAAMALEEAPFAYTADTTIVI